MALQINYDLNGNTITDAYIKVTGYSGGKTNMTYSYGVFSKETVNQEDGASVEIKNLEQELHAICAVDLDGGNPVQQAYLNLKTLPNMNGAIDV